MARSLKWFINMPRVLDSQFRRDGFTVAREVFSADQVAEIRDAFTELGRNGPVPNLSDTHRLENADPAIDPLTKWPRMMHMHFRDDLAVGPITMKYMLHPKLHPILRELFKEEPLAVQSMFYFKPPGARGQDLHQDNFYLKVKPGTCIAAWIAIDDADEENGGIVCVPGTGDLEIACPERADATKFFTTEHVSPPAGLKEVPVNLKAGDVLFFNGSTIHGSPPNRSETRFRRALICHYVGESSRELSPWYRKPMSFDHRVHEIPEATGGGPCGTPQEISSAH
jgi:ectoine hydroxylase-related dioxygenase (phytanoyl-CoA dioxygenase family)